MRPGERLWDVEGWDTTVERIGTPRDGFVELYNLEVEEYHTYLVGAFGAGSALVHHGKGNDIEKSAVPTEADHVRGVKAPGRYDATVGSEPQARGIVRQALLGAVELPPAVAGEPYPSPPSGTKQWYQSHPPDAVPGSGEPNLPHIKYADWTRGKKGRGGSHGHLYFPPGE